MCLCQLASQPLVLVLVHIRFHLRGLSRMDGLDKPNKSAFWRVCPCLCPVSVSDSAAHVLALGRPGA